MRTEEQIVGEIDVLVSELLRAKEAHDERGNALQVSAWVLFAERISADAADMYSSVSRISSSESLSWPHAIGIVRAGALRLEAEWISDDD